MIMIQLQFSNRHRGGVQRDGVLLEADRERARPGRLARAAFPRDGRVRREQGPAQVLRDAAWRALAGDGGGGGDAAGRDDHPPRQPGQIQERV